MLAAVSAALLVAALDAWVYTDARARHGTRRGVTVTMGSVRIDRPEAWAAACLVLFVLFFPLNLTGCRSCQV